MQGTTTASCRSHIISSCKLAYHVSWRLRSTGLDVERRLHVALQGVPAIAFSYNNYRASKPSDFAVAATHCLHIIKATLARCSGNESGRDDLAGNVINVNIPDVSFQMPVGYYLSHMSRSCVMARFAVASKSYERSDCLRRHDIPDTGDHIVLKNQNPEFHKYCASACVTLTE
jgi:hypothetical protein